MKRYKRYWQDEIVLPLTPHEAQPEVDTLGKEGELESPTIFLSLLAYRDIQSIIECAGQDEIGWMGTVDKLPGGQYLIGEVFLFKQDVSSGHCEFEQGDIGAFYSELLGKNPANRLLVNRIKFWGHLHPGDFADPSRQDDDQMEVFGHNKFMLRGIFTRGGRAKFTLYDYERGLMFSDCPWHLQIPINEDRKKEIAREIKQKVQKKFTAVSRSFFEKRWFSGDAHGQ